MKLSKRSLQGISLEKGVILPQPVVFYLPEKILQFGTGVFLRGLIDFIIDRANNKNEFNGRVVVVKSTSVGSTEMFKDQDNLYTLIMKSIENQVEVEEIVICAAISRVINAEAWRQVLDCAANEELKIVISNTTEIGIIMEDNDSIALNPPKSFPAKLLSFLYERHKIFNGSPESGLIIIPTELITNNATKLKDILNRLALQNKLGDSFIKWLNECNDFCNSLVDRIVPGKLPIIEQFETQNRLGYEDDLMIMSETFGLWAIETSNPKTQGLLSFSKTFSGVHIVPSIDKFRELKLRLLNASHNLSCALGFLAGFKTVKDAMANSVFDKFMQKLINEDISKAIVSEKISIEEAQEFGTSVLDRYRNPYIKFEWLSICVQDTSKIRIRAVPVVNQYFDKYGFVPDSICLAFAGYILFMKSIRDSTGNYIGSLDGQEYIINDDYAENLYYKWNNHIGLNLVQSVLSDKILWDIDLNNLSGFSQRVYSLMENLQKSGFFNTVGLLEN
ncbi:MAG TPA: tagaturonate reductase [Hanamia sp.]|nr:tagaturonate reductase [Hanamia sp.]